MNTQALVTIRPELLSMSAEQLHALAPVLTACAGAVLAILASVTRMLNPKWLVFILAVVTSIVAGVQAEGLIHESAVPLFSHMLVSDAFGNFFNLIFLGSLALTAIASLRYLDRDGIQHPEYYVLLMLSAVGMMVMASATDLVVVFIALELMSLAVYVLVGFRRTDRRSNEAAMKYFILGSAASAVLLYGAALLYGSTGSTNIVDILAFVQSPAHPSTLLFTLGVWLVVIGFLFKVAAVPFHMWMPDVYEGAPAPVTGFMTTGLKTAAFAAFVRVFVGMGYGKGFAEAVQLHIHNILWVSAVLTMGLGNFVALTQTNLKRMLAYSSIAHSGYLLVGMIAAPASEQGFAPVVMYLLSYAVMNLGAFIVLTALAARGDAGLNLHDMSGLSRRHPLLAFAMAVFLFSMAGIPPTAGFAAKYYLFYSAIQAGEIPLVVISVLCSAVSVFFYLRVLVYMYMRDPVDGSQETTSSAWSTVAVAAMVILTFGIGLLPSGAMTAARRAVTQLTG